MIVLNNLTLGSNQTVAAVLADGSTVNLVFYYHGATNRWSFDVAYPKNGFQTKGKGLSTFPNLLRLWGQANVIPFGLQVATLDGTDPFMASDLAPGAGGNPPRVIVTVLDQTNGNTDVTDVEAEYFQAGAAPAY